MSFFDQAYDDMSLEEVCYRLPSDLAVNALKRRVTNLDTLMSFIEKVQSPLWACTPVSVNPTILFFNLLDLPLHSFIASTEQQ